MSISDIISSFANTYGSLKCSAVMMRLLEAKDAVEAFQ